MRRLASPADEEETNVDLTPMLDVVFIMLIFFIVTATFVNERGLDFNRPESTNDAPPPDTDLQNAVIKIDASNKITVNGHRVDIRAVEANVRRIFAENPKAAVVVVANNAADSGVFVEVTDAAREAAPSAAVALTLEDE